MTAVSRWAPRLLLALCVALGLLVVGAGDAAAHTRTEETTNLDSRLVETPDLPGTRWTVHTGGFLIEVEHHGDGTLVVEGYDGEPYLRLSPDGVERNRRSPATYLNRERYGDVAIPPDVDPQAPPDWVHVDDIPRHVWHDHRTHWMATGPPPFVDAAPLTRVLMEARLVGPVGTAGEDAGVFQQWTIPVSHDGQGDEVRGELAWVDPPSPLPWLLVGALLVAPALLGLRRRHRSDIVRPAAAVVAGVAAINGIHLVDDLIAFPADPLDELFGVLHTTLFLGVGLGASVWAWRMPSGRVLALGVASGAVFYHQGLVHLPMLFASQFPTVWPDSLVRLTVALGALQAVVVAVVVLHARRVAAAPAASGSGTAGAASAAGEDHADRARRRMVRS